MLYRFQVFLNNIYSRISKIGKIIKLLFGSRPQLLYTRLKLYIFLVNLSTEVVCCCVLGFIYYLRAGYYIRCVVLFWRCINSSMKCGFFLEIINTRFSVMLCRSGPIMCVSSWRTCLRLMAYSCRN